MRLAARLGFGSTARREPASLSPLGPPRSADRLRAEIDALRAEENWAGIDTALQSANVNDIDDPLILRDIIVDVANSLAEQDQIDKLRRCLSRLKFASIDENTLSWTDKFLPKFWNKRKIVFTTELERKPKNGEFVIIYGNYPYIFDNIVVNNPVKRNYLDFWKFQHDVFEYDPCWERVDQIYVLNLDSRIDRWASVLRELGRMNAPFHRITRMSAVVDETTNNPVFNGHIGCLRSHILMLEDAVERQFEHILILEDDFCFTEDIDRHKENLRRFLERSYDYLVCLVATSKHGRIVVLDDLVCASMQPCTNTAGYMISREGMKQVMAVMQEGLHKLIETGDSETYAADRYWSRLQPTGKFLTFRHKLGFQMPNFSSIEREINVFMD
jgi:hypothetical protein